MISDSSASKAGGKGVSLWGEVFGLICSAFLILFILFNSKVVKLVHGLIVQSIMAFSIVIQTAILYIITGQKPFELVWSASPDYGLFG